MESSQGLYEVDKRDSIVSILQMRKLNLRKVQVIFQGLTWLIQLFPKKRMYYLIIDNNYLENHKFSGFKWFNQSSL